MVFRSVDPSCCYTIILKTATKSPSVISLIHPLKNHFTRRKSALGMEKENNIYLIVRINWKINCVMDASGGINNIMEYLGYFPTFMYSK